MAPLTQAPTLFLCSLAMIPATAAHAQDTAQATDPGEFPTSCDVIFDAELGQAYQENWTSGNGDANSGRLLFGDLYDLLVADDFVVDRAGRITDVYAYYYTFMAQMPADGVRIYFWGNAEVPSAEPTQTWDVPPDQVYVRDLPSWEMGPIELQATGLDIPYEAGRHWITVQPHDESDEGDWYYILRNSRAPLQGDDAFCKDGPNGEGGYGSTEWRRLSDVGYEVGDGFIRLEGCPEPLTISVDGQCGDTVTFSWKNAPRNAYITFIYAKNTGSFTIPSMHVCSGTELGLGPRRIQEAFSVKTGETGDGSIDQFLPPRACPGYFQAVIQGDGPCAISNVIATP